ncbi:MAG: hypothetical protein H7Y08_11925 [Rhizobiaceae bacterium]|nr:hypothetical protein [Rhizobiaceae bacterium]
MAKHLTARNIAEDFGETSRHWTKMAAAGLVPGAFQPKDKTGWLFDADAFRVWHEAGQPKVERPPAPARKEAAKVLARPDPLEKQRRKRAEIDAGIADLVRSAVKPRPR